MKALRTKSLIAGLLGTLLLTACGVNPTATLSGAATDVSAESTSLKYQLGADISQDPGVDFDDEISIQDASPVRVDLRSGCSPVGDQGKFGSCTSFATVKGLQEFLMKKQHRLTAQAPAYIWYESRRQTGQKGKDGGVPTEFAVKMLDAYGSVDEDLFPYLAADKQSDTDARTAFLSLMPGGDLEKMGKKNRIISGYKIATKISAVRKSLIDGIPVVVAMKVFSNIGRVGSDGMLSMPTAKDKFEGGHAVLCVGYDNAKKVLIIRNSWGSKWADGGYFYMPFDYVRAGGVRLAVIPKL